MTLQTTCSSALTASRHTWLVLALCACLAGGCAAPGTRTARVPTQAGYADLDVLVRAHPGWPGVAQYDKALTRLRNASVRLERPAEDKSLAALPAIDTLAPPSLAALRRGQQQRLSEISASQVAQVRERRALARARQLAPLRKAWQREASAEYSQAYRLAQREFLRRTRRTMAAGDVQRLNLTLQIKALRDIVESWKASTPPTPRLLQARRDLAGKLAQAARLDSARAAEFQAAAADRNKAIAQASAARDGYVQRLARQKEALLEAQDEQQTAAFAHTLAAQQQALLIAQTVHPVADVAAAGPLGAEALPPGSNVAALSAGSTAKAARQLRLAETRLAAQRARWLTFIYDDTRAAALDAAQKQHWSVVFAKSGPGLPLTAPLAQLLARQGWRT